MSKKIKARHGRQTYGLNMGVDRQMEWVLFGWEVLACQFIWHFDTFCLPAYHLHTHCLPCLPFAHLHAHTHTLCCLPGTILTSYSVGVGQTYLGPH